MAAPLVLWRFPSAGLPWLVGLAAAVTLYALVRRPDPEEGCGCGTFWAVSPRYLPVRNALLLALAAYAWRAAPQPLPASSAAYGLLMLLAALLAAGLAEAVRLQLRSR